MFTDRFRGRRGFLGWLILKWDVWQVRRFARRIVRLHRRQQRSTWPHRHS